MAELSPSNQPAENYEKTTNGLTNGFSNGTSEHRESSSKDKDKSRHRDSDRHKSSHKDKNRDRHSSSGHKSSHKEKHRDKDRPKDDKDRHKERSKDDKDRSKDSSSKSVDDKDRHRSDKHKDDKHRHRDDRERSKSDKDRSKHESSSKDRSKDDKDRRKDDKDRHKSDSKHRSSDKSSRSSDKHKSSSSSHRSSHSSSHKSSHKDKHRDKSRDEKIKTETIKTEPMEVDYPSTEVEEPAQMDYIKQEEPTEAPATVPISYEATESEEDDSKLVIKEEKIEEEDDDEDDVPLAARKRVKVDVEESDDEKPLLARKKLKKEKKRKNESDYEDDEDDFKPPKKKIKSEKPKKTKYMPVTPTKSSSRNSRGSNGSPTKAQKKKKEEEENVWKWWEEEKRDDGVKWTFLEHKGPVFADPYERVPKNVKFYYDGKHLVLSRDAEEVAGFYARMLDHDYTTKEVFNRNFFKDWRKQMTSEEQELIIDLKKCNFKQLQAFYLQQSEERKNRTKEQKKALKEKNEAIVAEYGWCTIDGHKQKIGNFKIEPPGLFRGRGEHPKQGMLKKRTVPEEVIINCSKNSVYPKAPEGRRWKEVRHDNTVSWLACWNENIQGQTKYVMLNAASRLKGEKDWQKYETARRLHKHIDKIRGSYQQDWKSKEMKIRQRGVALYFIDILALRAGNEKDEDQADTVGCCSLRVEHIKLHEQKSGKNFVVVFDFLGKDSIRYYNEITVEKRVFKNLQLFMENKDAGDDLFDRLNTAILNKYLNELLDGLTAKVFRTYNASRTLQEQLEKLTDPTDNVAAQVLTYNRANREVAILCNHQRSVPKTYEKSMANLQQKIDDKRDTIRQAEKDVKDLKRAAKQGGSMREKDLYEKKKRAIEKLKEQLEKLEISATDKEENKQIALGTSKLNYLDPRISVAWCKRYNIPIEKVYNKTQRQKFQWAIDMATSEYNFTGEPMRMNDSQNDDEEEESEEE